jgi:hypothetical protein
VLHSADRRQLSEHALCASLAGLCVGGVAVLSCIIILQRRRHVADCWDPGRSVAARQPLVPVPVLDLPSSVLPRFMCVVVFAIPIGICACRRLCFQPGLWSYCTLPVTSVHHPCVTSCCAHSIYAHASKQSPSKSHPHASVLLKGAGAGMNREHASGSHGGPGGKGGGRSDCGYRIGTTCTTGGMGKCG